MIRNLFEKKPEVIETRAHTEADPYLEAAGHDESNWLVSYADMMTLLCGFFIMLFSIATIDSAKYQRVQESIAKQFGGKFEAKHEENARFLTQILTEKGIADQALVKAQPDGVSVVLQTQQFFDSLSTEITPSGMQVLGPLVKAIHELESKEKKTFRIVVEGHSDSRPILSGPYPSNWELSSARAGRVVRFFVDQGFSPKTLSAAGFAETQPEVSREPAQMTEADHARNRRVVIRVIEAAPTESRPSGPAPTTGQSLPGEAPGTVPSSPAQATAEVAPSDVDLARVTPPVMDPSRATPPVVDTAAVTVSGVAAPATDRESTSSDGREPARAAPPSAPADPAGFAPPPIRR